MTSDERETKTLGLLADVMGQFFVPLTPSDLLSEFAVTKASLPPVYSELGAAFEKNILAVSETVGIPFTLAYAAAEGSHWQRILTAERIRSLRLDQEAEESEEALELRRNEHARAVASQRMEEFAASSDGQTEIIAAVCSFLLNSLKSSKNLLPAAEELTLQGTVLTWSALESLARDLFEVILNSDPKRALVVMQEPSAKQRLQSRFTLEELASFGFNLSCSLGSVLSSQQDFSDIRTIKAAILPALDYDADAAKALAEKKLWILCQQRHLIIHRRGVFDSHYLEATGDQREVGSRLSVTPTELESHMRSVVVAGCALLTAAGKQPSS